MSCLNILKVFQRLAASATLLAFATMVTPCVAQDDPSQLDDQPRGVVVSEFQKLNNGNLHLIGQTVGGLREGRWEWVWPETGQTQEVGNYKANLRIGTWQTYASNGALIQRISYDKGVREGFSTLWSGTGVKLLEVYFVAGAKSGIAMGWHRNGNRLYEMHYTKGLRDGIAREWYENGRLRLEENYQADELDGDRTEWDEEGNVLRVETYKKGVLQE